MFREKIQIKNILLCNKEDIMYNNKDIMYNNKDLDNSKRILCYNIINNKMCSYGSKCMYAHSLSEQKIDPIRHKVYTLLKNTTDLHDLDLINDNKLFKALSELTKVCSMCIKKICPGGYNCRNGTINYNLKVCYEDLMYGHCKRDSCLSIHLTERGLISYYQQKDKKIFTNDYKKNKNIKSKNILSDISGILLTEKFLMTHFNTNSILESSDDETEEDITRIKKFLNDSSDDDINDGSIFTDHD